ncbi:MAG: hypothetical protein AUI11_00535 [Acidobacteria bacterium 13_2_20CM_2_66_4]|nr:MAG: hypothetical protein AUI11_00535 [Acidobacteria bacterium 13_2_20CM_2_66_4]
MASVIDPRARIGAVHLTISSLDDSIRFYQAHLGFVVHRREERIAWLGAGGADLLVLSACERAPRARGTTGLYHFAVLVPTRADLARAFMRLVETDTLMQGDLASAASQSGAGLARETVIGHVHLHVSRLDEAQRFYVDVLGFELMQRYGPSALFVSAGGYHHHIGLNTWAGVGAPPAPPGAIGLRHFDVMLSDESARSAVEERLRAADVPIERTDEGLLVRDPAKNFVLLTVAAR